MPMWHRALMLIHNSAQQCMSHLSSRDGTSSSSHADSTQLCHMVLRHGVSSQCSPDLVIICVKATCQHLKAADKPCLEEFCGGGHQLQQLNASTGTALSCGIGHTVGQASTPASRQCSSDGRVPMLHHSTAETLHHPLPFCN